MKRNADIGLLTTPSSIGSRSRSGRRNPDTAR